MVNEYSPTIDIYLDELASRRSADLTRSDPEDGRVIGGDRGDLRFSGYFLRGGRTILYDPILVTTLGDLTDDEVDQIAFDILNNAYNSIGIEAVE